MYPNTYQLREEAISLMSFKFHVEISSAYLFVIDLAMKKQKSVVSSTSSLEISNPTGGTSSNENKTDNDTGDSTAPQIILYSLAKSPNENYNLVTIDLTKEIADQVFLCIYLPDLPELIISEKVAESLMLSYRRLKDLSAPSVREVSSAH